MAKNDAGKYPLLVEMAKEQEFLDHNIGDIATTEERIKSIWPYLVKRSVMFYKTLKPREQVAFDPEDIALELYVALREKDEFWDAAKGKYITFAMEIINRELCSIRDRAPTVESPRNSACRMREYDDDEENGDMTERKRRTAAQILSTKDIAAISTDREESGVIAFTEESAADVVIKDEKHVALAKAVSSAIRMSLDAVESAVLGRTYGLWGCEEWGVRRIAIGLRKSMPHVNRMRSTALRKIKRHFTLFEYPAITDWLSSKIS